jgi:cytochrome c-type biogenesis protein CcsB
MVSAYGAGRAPEFNRALGEYRALIAEPMAPEVRKAAREFLYNSWQPFLKSLTLYVLVFLAGCLSWFGWFRVLNRGAFYLLVLAFLVHTAGIGFRMVLEGRPPVTNLYSSAVFVGWGAVLLGLIIEWFYRNSIGIVKASAIGFLTQVVAHNLSLDGDTMEMLRAVLDTNFWLATHVVTITIGYSATFVAGFLAVIFVLLGLFTDRLKRPFAGAGTEGGSDTGGLIQSRDPMAKVLGQMVYGAICFATLFSFVGTVLGGIWADQSWGRFWGWDPKENGALIIVLWNAIILHARWGRLVRERGLMNLAIFGNVVTSFSWFGVNMLGVGLHSYGFMDQAFVWLMAFVASQVLLIAASLIRNPLPPVAPEPAPAPATPA